MSASNDRQLFIGIDFGTSSSKMAWYDCESHPKRANILRNAEGKEQTPSAIYYGKHEVMVGKPALEMLSEDSESHDVILSIKRHLWDTFRIPVQDGRSFTPVEITTDILRQLRQDANTQHFQQEVNRCVLTHPATMGSAARENLRNAARAAGFTEVELVSEPVAAAIAYVQRGMKAGKHVLVYDLGAGTFDLALLARQSDGTFEPILFRGIEICGGDDFDNALYQYCDQVAQQQLGRPISLTPDRDLSVLDLCREAKERLSRAEKYTLRARLKPNDTPFKCEITRKKFEDLISALVDRTIQKTQALLQEAKNQSYTVDTLVLIGGSTRVPLIKEQLSRQLQELKIEILEWGERDLAVALGAAYYGAVKFYQEKLRVRGEEGSYSSILVVSPKGDEAYTTIGAALQAAQPNHRILVRPGLYREGLVLNKPIGIIGDGPREQIIVESSDADCIAMNTTEATVQGLTLRSRIANPRKKFFAVYIPQGCLRLIDCDVTSDSLACIAICGAETDPTIQGCRIHDGNSAGVVVYQHGKGRLEKCEILGNALAGIQIKEGGNPFIHECLIRFGKAGGLFVSHNGLGSIEHCRIVNNAKAGIEVKEQSNPSIRNCHIADNGYVGIWVHHAGKGYFQQNKIQGNKHEAWKFQQTLLLKAYHTNNAT